MTARIHVYKDLAPCHPAVAETIIVGSGVTRH